MGWCGRNGSENNSDLTSMKCNAVVLYVLFHLSIIGYCVKLHSAKNRAFV